MTEASSTLHRYLLGAMQQLETTMTVRAHCLESEVDRLPEILRTWRIASERMQELARSEKGAADGAIAEEPPAALKSRLSQIESDPLFKAGFSLAPSKIRIVDLRRLVAPQRDVNLEYVRLVRERIPENPNIGNLVEFCLAPRDLAPPVRALQTAQNQMTFSSPSIDLRFLGGYMKPLGEDDIRAAFLGGQPVQVISLLIGFGAAPINVWQAGSRLVLKNGFHRVFALCSAGVTLAPVVVQYAANPEVEFPAQILGLSRSYLLQSPRPVMVKDFFDDRLTLDLRLKARMKTVKVGWGADDGVVPIG